MGDRWKRWPGWLLAAVMLTQAGCGRQDPERLAGVGRKVADKSQAFLERTHDRLTRRGPSAAEDDLEARVAARLRWDRGLAEAHVEVKASGAAVELRGTVAGPHQRRRAVELAETTAGVEKVVDALAVAGAGR